MSLPFVSCMCCTYGRPALLEEAVECFLRQDYAGPAELVIWNDLEKQRLMLAEDVARMSVVTHGNVVMPRTVRIINTGRLNSYGAKRHAIVARCHGDVLAPWDDDDIHLPWRLRVSVEHLGGREYWKPKRVWFDRGAGPELRDNLVCHAQAVFTRGLYDRCGGYPDQEQSTDTVLEKQMGDARTVEHIAVDDLYYIYRWGSATPGAPHNSGNGNGNARVLAHGEAQTAGTYMLTPRWRADYVQSVRRAIAML